MPQINKLLSTNKIWILTVFLLLWAITASISTSYYFQLATNNQLVITTNEHKIQNTDTLNITTISIQIDFGNSTKIIENNIILTSNQPNVFNSTLSTIKGVEYTIYGDGVFIDSIYYVYNNKTTNQWWIYTVQRGENEIIPNISADKFLLQDDDIIKWLYKTL